MDTTHDDTDALTTAHNTRKKLLTIIACTLIIIVGAAGVVMAQSSFDGFEDGDANGWETTEASTEVNNLSIEGQHSLLTRGSIDEEIHWTVPSNTSNTNDNYIRGVLRTPNTTGSGTALVLGKVESKHTFTDPNDRKYFVRIGGGNWEFIEQSTSGSTIVDTIKSAPSGTWRAFNLSVVGGEYRFRTWDANNTEPGTWDYTNQSAVNMNNLRIWTTGSVDWHLDEIGANTAPPDDTLKGRVTDQSGDGIADASVEADSGATATTNGTGYYSLDLVDGTHNVTAKKPGFANQTKEVTISGGEQETLNFTLIEKAQALDIDTRLYLKHGTEARYTVTHGFVNDQGRFVRENVTANATVTSNDTNVVTVNETRQVIVATDDVTVNNRTFVTANYTRDDGTLLQDTQNVTVANKTVENLDILPPVTRFGASIDDKTLQTILIATGVGAAAALITSAFGGIAALTLIMIMGWVIGVVGDGMIIVTLVTSMFIGLNVAGNVDYTVRR